MSKFQPIKKPATATGTSPQEARKAMAEPEKGATFRVETKDAPKARETPAIGVQASVQTETSPLAVPPRGFFGKPPSPGGIGSGCARP